MGLTNCKCFTGSFLSNSWTFDCYLVAVFHLFYIKLYSDSFSLRHSKTMVQKLICFFSFLVYSFTCWCLTFRQALRKFCLLLRRFFSLVQWRFVESEKNLPILESSQSLLLLIDSWSFSFHKCFWYRLGFSSCWLWIVDSKSNSCDCRNFWV